MTNASKPLSLLFLLLACSADTDDSPADYDVDVRSSFVQCTDGTYDIEQMNATLAAFPELAEAIQMTQVDGCDDAPEYLARVAEHIESRPSTEEIVADDDFRIAHAEASNLTTGGVLQLSGGCTGVLIHTRALITAAHCVDDLVPPGVKNFWQEGYSIYDFSGDSYTGTVRINIHPDYAGNGGDEWVGDDGDDIAVVKLTSGSFGFADANRHRLYVGPMSTIGTMRAYGRGVISHDGGGAGVLRRMVYTPDWTGPEHFLMDAETSRTCKGDSGGPIMDVLPDGVTRVVAGLITSGEVGHEDDQCTTTGGKQRAVRVQNKVRWIDQMIGGNDSDDCQPLTMDGWQYERCW
jgi:hypothetical protein